MFFWITESAIPELLCLLFLINMVYHVKRSLGLKPPRVCVRLRDHGSVLPACVIFTDRGDAPSVSHRFISVFTGGKKRKDAGKNADKI